MKSREWLIPAVTGVIGMTAGVWIAGGLSSEDATLRTSPMTSTLSTPAAARIGEGGPFPLEDVRRVVRQELDARAPATQLAGVASPPAETPNEAQVLAATQARAVLDSAIARRTWTEPDSDALREDFHMLTPDQQAELLQAYAMAVNQGRLVPQTDRAPF